MCSSDRSIDIETNLLPAAIMPDCAPDPRSNILHRDLSTLSWSVAAILLLFLCLTHLGVLLCFSFGTSVSAFIVPGALSIALVIGYMLGRLAGLRGKTQIVPPAISLAVAAISLPLAAAFFDMSWDGLWYHQKAVYQMAHGWNPLYEPMREFSSFTTPWLRHYAKGPWYISLALLQFTHDIEWSKAAPWMMLAATFFSVLAACIDYEMSRAKSALIAALVALNPVITCQLPTIQVDGLLASYMACFVAATFSYFKRRSPLIVCVIAATAILCINVKFTGLVYLCFISAAAGLYAIIKRRDVFLKYAVVQIVPYMLGIFLFGYNPYITNYVHRGHPFYPLMGTKAFPSHDQQGRDPVELYETPSNMKGSSAWYRHFCSIFGRPYNIYDGSAVQLIRPFEIRWNDVEYFRFHELRIGGFGPLFSGALIIGLFLLAIAMLRPGIPRGIVLLFIVTIIMSLMISRHTWWARFAPQVWWLPIVAVIAGLAISGWRAARWAAGGLAAILLINAILVAGVHFKWEFIATRKTYEQLAFLKDKDVEIDFAYFREPFGERLKAAGVTFHPTRNMQGENIFELMSVMPDNPLPVRARIKEN
jgi:hypothetical protein